MPLCKGARRRAMLRRRATEDLQARDLVVLVGVSQARLRSERTCDKSEEWAMAARTLIERQRLLLNFPSTRAIQLFLPPHRGGYNFLFPRSLETGGGGLAQDEQGPSGPTPTTERMAASGQSSREASPRPPRPLKAL